MSSDGGSPPEAKDALIDDRSVIADKLWEGDLPNSCSHDDSILLPTSHPDVDARVAVRYWSSKGQEPKGVVVIFHGLHSHSGRWTRVAGILVNAGFAVYAPDHILHGRSSPEHVPVCDIPDFGYFVTDAGRVISHAGDAHPNLPLFILGHSMGSIITMHVMHNNPTVQRRVRAVIYSGFALHPGPSAAAPMGMKCLFCLIKGCCGICLGGCLAGCGPMADGSVIDVTNLHHNKELFSRMEVDPLHFKGAVRNRMGFELLKAARRLESENIIEAIDYPFLAMHGAADDIAFVSGSEALFDRASTGPEEKHIKIYSGVFHEVLNDFKVEGYTADSDLLNFLQDQVAKHHSQ